MTTPEVYPLDLDLLIVLGKNIGVGSSPENIRHRHDRLSRGSRINALAAGALWLPDTDLLFSGGQTAGPDITSEAQAMKTYFMQKYPAVPEGYLSTEDFSLNTADNAERVARMLAIWRYRRIGLITVGHHLPRAESLFREYGVKVDDTYVSEEVLRGRSHLHNSYVNQWSQSRGVRRERRREFILRKLLIVDSKGKIPHSITARTRA